MEKSYLKKNKKLIAGLIVLIVFVCFSAFLILNRDNSVVSSQMSLNDSGYTDLLDSTQSKDTTIPENQDDLIFVSSTGSDSGSGTEASPYKTISYALSVAQPGQTIYLRAGTYNELVDFTVSGEDGSPITLRNYPGEEAIITATDISGADAIIDLNNCDYINLIGLTIEGITETSNWAAYGVLLRGGNEGCVISECEFYDINSNGTSGNASPITLWGETTEPISNMLIYGNYIHDCELGWSEGIALDGNIEYVDIIGNTIEDVTNIGIDVEGLYGVCADASLDYSRYVYVAENTTSGCVSSVHQSAGIYVDGASYVLVERNISYNNTLGIEVGCENSSTVDSYYPHDNIVANNLIYGNTATGIRLGGYSEGAGKTYNTKIYNNTVIHPSTAADAALCIQIGDGYDITNNIIVDEGTWNLLVSGCDFDSTLVQNVQFNNNLLYHANATSIGAYIQIGDQTYTTDEFEALSTTSENILEQSANLTTEYRLQDSSPAVATGLSNTEILSYLDLDGVQRATVVDMGCYVYTLASSGDEVDKTALKAIIDSVDSLNETDYTPESWADLEEALQEANTVYNNEDATQAEVDAANEALQLAIDNLVLADKVGSITIILAEETNGDPSTSAAISGVEYTIYRVDDVDGVTVTTVDEAEAILSTLTAVDTQTTDEDGTAVFSDLETGRYYVKVTSVPSGISETPESFLVDIPMTNSTGDGYIYDITVYPKVEVIAGSVQLVKKDQDGDIISGISFTLQYSVKNDDGTWSDTWSTYSDVGTLKTDSTGIITVSNLPRTYNSKEVRFRFYENAASTGVTGTTSTYIRDNSELDYFYIQEDGNVVVVHYDGTEEDPASIGTIEVINESPKLSKTVATTEDSTYGTYTSASVSDTIYFKITVGIPSAISKMTTFKLEDTMESGLAGINNLEIVGIKNGEEVELVESEDYTLTMGDNTFSIDFVISEISELDSIEITYDTMLDMDNAVIGSLAWYDNDEYEKNKNKVTLTYNNFISTDGTGTTEYSYSPKRTTVFTGGIQIYKHDTSDTPLAGAVFKIATSEENAKAGIFVKDADGNDLTATTGDDGYAQIYGLAYDTDGAAYYSSDDIDLQNKTYYLVEVQAPTYTEEVDGETVTKYYSLLAEPVEVEVNGYSHLVENAVDVTNRKSIDLPLTGGIGIAIFVVAGIVIMSLAIVSKKQNKVKNEV